MNVYIAAPWAEKEGLAKQAQLALEEAGHTVTSRWINLEGADNGLGGSSAFLRTQAINDIEDVINSNMMIFINSGSTTGGCHTEVGIAIAMLKPVIIVGERTNVFHYLRCPRVDTIEEAIKELDQWEPGHHKWPDVDETRGAVRK